MWQSSKAYPLAYCPPGSFCGMISIPRALPPVTHGSALQAPERMWSIIRGRILSRGQGTLHQAKDIVVAPGEPIFYCQRQLFCFLGA